MAEALEDMTCDTDRVLDSNGFLNNQFEVFTHDYREKTDVPKCSEHEGGTDCCEQTTVKDNYGAKRKDVVNITRRLQRALLTLKSMKGAQPIQDLIQQLDSLNSELQHLIKQETSEFSMTTVKLPEFDPVDMDLFIGKDEVPQTMTMLEAVDADRKAVKLRVVSILAEAEILLREFEHIKSGV